jgi:CelD/BcsL family acetyltransferase involved in cellulose biosynthesis
VVGADGRFVAGLPLAWIKSCLTGKRIVSLPFSDVVAPIYTEGFSESLETLLMTGLTKEQKRRGGVDLDLHEQLSGLEGSTPSQRFWHHTVALDQGFAWAERQFSSAARRGERKARREGVLVRKATDRPALDAFYRMHVRTRRKQGVPTQSKRFIREFANLFDDGLGYVMLAEFRGKPISGAVFLRWKDHLIYKYGASDRSQLDKRPNNLLFAEAIQDACDAKIRTLDLGRTDLTNAGLRAFKLGWGANEREISYTRVTRGKTRRSVRSISSVQAEVIRRTPPVVGRLVGAMLYRHFG